MNIGKIHQDRLINRYSLPILKNLIIKIILPQMVQTFLIQIQLMLQSHDYSNHHTI